MLRRSTVLILLIVSTAHVSITYASDKCSSSSECQNIVCDNVVTTLQKYSREARDRQDSSVEQIVRSVELLAITTEKRLAALEAIISRLEARENATHAEKEAERLRNAFVTNAHYENLRIVTDSKENIPSQLIPKDLTLEEATAECVRICDSNSNCHAFNLYETDDAFVCEPLADNLCLSQTRIAFFTHPKSTVWEKKSKDSHDSCLDAILKKNPDKSLCNILKPGCYGEWPSCTCAKTCKECPRFFSRRELEQGPVKCTLWPEGETQTTKPMFGLCLMSDTILSFRTVNLTTGVVEKDYRMSFEDMVRLSRLNEYNFLSFGFLDDREDWSVYFYDDWSIDENGTLSNLKYRGFLTSKRSDYWGDLLNLNREAMKPMPFVHVTDDRYGCGSFWLLDPQNATYCPGGQVSMFGKVEYDGSRVRKTGISFPGSESNVQVVSSVISLRMNA